MMSAFLSAWWTIEPLVMLTIPMVLFCWHLPFRPHAPARIALVVAGLAALAIVPLASGLVTGLDAWETFVVFSALLVLFVGLIMFVWDVSIWTAVFCATAGYMLQNIVSGLEILVQMLITGRANVALDEPAATIVMVCAPLVIYTCGYQLLARRVNLKGLISAENRMMLLMYAAVLVTVIGLDVLIKVITMAGAPFTYLVMMRVIHPTICVFMLYLGYSMLAVQHERNERAETERLLAERERQYRLSHENIEAINIKCHDIRHQIRHLGDDGVVVDNSALADIAREVAVYDSSVDTGNEALDTILTEKGLICSQEKIVLTVVADGTALDFMAPADIYAFFGNALDNAIEAVRQVEDPERRAISILVRRRGDMTAVSVENCCASEPRFSEDGLPVTTKSDTTSHGYGMRSMRAIAQRYHGSISADASDGVFYLNVLLAGPHA